MQVNHPFIPYGYFSSIAAGVAPGGFDGDFDLVEINSSVPKDDAKVLAKLWDFWNQGKHYYLTAGSDTHDVWNEQSGRVRTFVHIEGARERPELRGGTEGRPRLRDLRAPYLPRGDVRNQVAGHAWQRHSAALYSRIRGGPEAGAS